MSKYKSKIGLNLLLPIILIVGSIGAFMAYEKIWIGLLIILIVSIFIGHIFLSTYYIIENKVLRVKSGFIIDEKINIDTILKIEETNNALSAPANSLDRLLISYNKFNSILVSPKEKNEFITQLTLLNPNIEVVLKRLK